MEKKLADINKWFSQTTGVAVTKIFEQQGMLFRGSILLEEQGQALAFNVEILPHYPFQFHNSETIRFVNEDLVAFDHVNGDGSICVHTLHSPDLQSKIALDVNSLRHWMKRYYINSEKDVRYEHIIVPQNGFEGKHSIFLFTETGHQFKSGEFGNFEYSLLSHGLIRKENASTLLVQNFLQGKAEATCNWSNNYNVLPRNKGIYYFSDVPPVFIKRFAAINWQMLDTYFSQPFYSFLYQLQRRFASAKDKSGMLPLLLGYPVNETEVHWQAVLIPLSKFPNYGQKVLGTKDYVGKMLDQEIIWAQTRNCSYNYFFGRGLLHEKLSKGKILVIGIGALGSMVATTLVRGGCSYIGLIDHDIKEAENVCRSEYFFNTGTNKKIDDLANILANISPFVDIQLNEELLDLAKIALQEPEWRKEIEEQLNRYDIIFDCSTDNDVAYILDKLDINGKVFNLSITNHAQQLVCAVRPNLYDWLMNIFPKLEAYPGDLYEPTGCWAPTFKAGYNDISVMVQFAIKHINAEFSKGNEERNFYLSYSNEEQTSINLKQF